MFLSLLRDSLAKKGGVLLEPFGGLKKGGLVRLGVFSLKRSTVRAFAMHTYTRVLSQNNMTGDYVLFQTWCISVVASGKKINPSPQTTILVPHGIYFWNRCSTQMINTRSNTSTFSPTYNLRSACCK